MRLVDVDFLAAVALLTDEEKQVATENTQALAISVARLRLALRRVLIQRRGMPSIAAFANAILAAERVAKKMEKLAEEKP